MKRQAIPNRKCLRCGILKLLNQFQGGRKTCNECRSEIESERKRSKKPRTVLDKKMFKTTVSKHEKNRLTNQAYSRAETRLREIHANQFTRILDEERLAVGLPPSNRRYTY